VEKFNNNGIELSANPSKKDIFNIIMSSDSKNDWHRAEITERWKKEMRYFNRNVNLRFEMDEDGIVMENFREEWANRHPDSKATSYEYCLYFNSTLIHAFILVSVDGGWAKLPMPKSLNKLVVSPLDYKVAQIHYRLNSLDEYMNRSGLRVGRNTLTSQFTDSI